MLPNCSVAAASSVICTHWLRWILSVSFVPGCGLSLDAVLGDVDVLRDERDPSLTYDLAGPEAYAARTPEAL